MCLFYERTKEEKEKKKKNIFLLETHRSKKMKEIIVISFFFLASIFFFRYTACIHNIPHPFFSYISFGTSENDEEKEYVDCISIYSHTYSSVNITRYSVPQLIMAE